METTKHIFEVAWALRDIIVLAIAALGFTLYAGARNDTLRANERIAHLEASERRLLTYQRSVREARLAGRRPIITRRVVS